MKRIILFLALVSFIVPAFSQDYNGKWVDTTMANAGLFSSTLSVTGSKEVVTFQYDIVKNSGTVGGTIVVQGNVNTQTSAVSPLGWFTINSYTITDASATNVVALTSNSYIRYRVIITTTGTMNANIKVWILYRKAVYMPPDKSRYNYFAYFKPKIT